jgi:hypothetical protein
MSIGEAKVASESASSYALATCPEPALPDQVDHQGVDQLSEHEQEVGTIERG